jgi:hypothetical protein
MAPHRTARHLGLVALLAGALVPLGAGPAAAGPGCLDETRPPLVPSLPLPGGDGCDDSTPPETTVVPSTAPNAAGFVGVATMSFAVTMQVSDGDAGPFGLECRLVGPAQAHDWRSCASPVTYAGLPDGSYSFAARAVDLGDRALTPDDGLPPTVADTPDEDTTPATVAWTQDTRAPFVFVTQSAYDEQTPTQPVVTSDPVPVRLNSSEAGSTFECTDKGGAVPCSGPRWELAQPRAGRHVLRARAIDRAGNTSAWSEPIEFFVPRDLRRSRGWRTVRDAAYVDGDALRATRRGVRLVLPRTTVGELRLIAPQAPGLGKVRLRVGRRDWHVVDLAGARSPLQQYVVLDRYSGVRKGKVVIETLTNKPVVVDAVVARPSRFSRERATPRRPQPSR